MPYVVRNTFTPEYDVVRNWSAWIGNAWDSKEEALREIAELSPYYSEYFQRNIDSIDEEPLDEDALIEKIIANEEFDVRYNEAYGKWQHCHHDGLSCYELYAETEEEARIEANNGEYPWFGFGRSTHGSVRWIGHVRDELHLFWCEDTQSEY